MTCLQVLYLQAFVFVILMGKLFRKVFFGQLRAAEMEVIVHFVFPAAVNVPQIYREEDVAANMT